MSTKDSSSQGAVAKMLPRPPDLPRLGAAPGGLGMSWGLGGPPGGLMETRRASPGLLQMSSRGSLEVPLQESWGTLENLKELLRDSSGSNKDDLT